MQRLLSVTTQRLVAAVLLAGAAGFALAQARTETAAEDSDRDGVSDVLETALLNRFKPTVMVGAEDCSALPAEFLPNTDTPYVLADNGMIYGQAFPAGSMGRPMKDGGRRAERREIELHYYMLWRKDCGRMGHDLDTEHVSVLLRGESDDAERWRAVYWYAAAHEDTVCDASQLTRAATIDAETRGATVWVSNGKHGSFLNEELCRHGCGGDRCEKMTAIVSNRVVNLGEANAPMNGAAWTASSRWPLAQKMERSDFNVVRVARLEGLPATDVAWAEPSKRPAQAAIRGGNAGIDGALVGVSVGGSSSADALMLSNRRTDTALVLADTKTGNALGSAAQNTGKAMSKSYRGVRGALGCVVRHTGGALGVERRED